MRESLPILLAIFAGLVLGAIFFGGLWWTVRHAIGSPRPALWFLGSLLLRFGLVLVGFFFVGGKSWERLLACLVGFIAARLIVVALTRTKPTREVRHAS